MSAPLAIPRGFKRSKAACRVPASVANLGPGFDTLGMALGLYNELAAEIGADQTTVEVVGEGDGIISSAEDNLVVVSMMRTFKHLGRKPPKVWVRCKNAIPLSRGLGSSSAAIVGGIFLANELCGRPLDRDDLFQIAADIEGHPDNVAPALYGGLTVSVTDEAGKFHSLSVDSDSLSKWKYVVAIPSYTVSTAKARTLLPKRVSFDDAVYNVGRAAMVVAVLLKGPGKSSNAVLREAIHDRLHQTQRASLMAGRDKVFAAAYKAGALGVCVSGSGPTVLAISSKWANRIGEAMCKAFQRESIEARYEILPIETAGTISLGVHNL